MVICEYCYIWYHEDCCKGFTDEKEEKYKCKKCQEWLSRIQDPLLDIVLGRKSVDKYLSEDKETWTFDSIFFSEEDSKYAENKITEQILFTKTWYHIADYLLNNIVHNEQLIEEHILQHKRLFMKCSEMKNKLKRKLENTQKAIEEEVEKLKTSELYELLDEIDDQLKPIPENVIKNKKMVAK